MRRYLAVGAVCLLLLLAGLLLLPRKTPPEESLPPTHSLSQPHTSPKKSLLPKPLHVLFLGVDERPDDPGRSDTMILARVAGEEIRLLSLPRDAMVELEGYGREKLNAAYAYGGPELAKKTVSALLGLPVDRYVKVNLQGFRRMVDLIGGVPYVVERPMYYVDPAEGLVIDLKPGYQVLDGDKAEQYVRFRYDESGDDLSRIRRQQSFLRAAARHALRPENLPKLPGLIHTAVQYVETDLTPAEQFQIVLAAFAAHQAGAVTIDTLPGYGDYIDGISYFLTDREALEQLLKDWRPDGQS